MINRREFERMVLLVLASLETSSWTTCGEKAGDLISSLAGILQAVEKALKLLSALSGLLPDTVNLVADYLLKVTHFVQSAGQILENGTLNAADKATQILMLAGDLVVPALPDSVAPIINAVLAAVNRFLSFFGSDVDHAKRMAQTRSGEVPKDIGNLNPSQIAKIKQIEQDASKDAAAILDWKQKATIVPAK